MKTSRKLFLNLFFAILTLTPGPICYLIYSQIVSYNPSLSMSLVEQRSNVAVIVATFACTMLGFLAAVITILFTFAGSKTFQKYKKNGHLDVFFFIYFLTIFCLIITFALGLLSLSTSTSAMLFSIMAVVNNLVQIAILTWIIVSLSYKASLSN